MPLFQIWDINKAVSYSPNTWLKNRCGTATWCVLLLLQVIIFTVFLDSLSTFYTPAHISQNPTHSCLFAHPQSPNTAHISCSLHSFQTSKTHFSKHFTLFCLLNSNSILITQAFFPKHSRRNCIHSEVSVKTWTSIG